HLRDGSRLRERRHDHGRGGGQGGVKALLPLALILALVACGPGEMTFDHDYVIPSGTGARLDAGEPVEMLPFILEARVGETLRIVNRDFRGHRIGLYYVGSGESVT